MRRLLFISELWRDDDTHVSSLISEEKFRLFVKPASRMETFQDSHRSAGMCQGYTRCRLSTRQLVIHQPTTQKPLLTFNKCDPIFPRTHAFPRPGANKAFYCCVVQDSRLISDWSSSKCNKVNRVSTLHRPLGIKAANILYSFKYYIFIYTHMGASINSRSLCKS